MRITYTVWEMTLDQFRRRFHAHGFGVADPAYPCQLRDVESKESTQPTMVRQQSL